MRRALVLLAFCLSCSNDSTDPIDPPGNETFYRISGTVEDSILGTPVAGVRVLIGDSSVLTDASGHYATTHRSGDLTVEVNDYRYENYQVPVSLLTDGRIVTVRLRGNAPYITACTFETDLLTARLVDLQGRKTINRRSQSTITLISSDTTVFRDAYNWFFTPVDTYTWLAHVPHAGVPADSAVWRVEDADGFTRTVQCVNQPPPCSFCAPRRRG
jgi:hypothetical protein